MKKRFLASLLSLVMLLTMLPVTAFAAGNPAVTKVTSGTKGVNAKFNADTNAVELVGFLPTPADNGTSGSVQLNIAYTDAAGEAQTEKEETVSLTYTPATTEEPTSAASWDVATDPTEITVVDTLKLTVTCSIEVGSAKDPAITGVTSKTQGVTATWANDTVTLSGELAAPAEGQNTGTVTLDFTYTDAAGETQTAADVDVTLTYTAAEGQTPASWALPSGNKVEVVTGLEATLAGTVNVKAEGGEETTTISDVDVKDSNSTVTATWENNAVKLGGELAKPADANTVDVTLAFTLSNNTSKDVTLTLTYTDAAGNTPASWAFDNEVTVEGELKATVNGTVSVKAEGGETPSEPVEVALEKSVPNTITDADLTITGETGDTEITTISVPADGTAKVKVAVKETYVVTPTGEKVTVSAGQPTTASGVTTTVYTLSAAQTGAKVTFTVAEKNDETSGEITLSKDTGEDANITVLPAKAIMTNGTATVEITVAAGRELVAPTSDKFNVAIGTPADNKYTVTITLKDGVATFPTDAALTFATSAVAPAPAEKYTIKFAAGTGASGTMANVEVAKNASGATEYPVPKCTFTTPTGKEFDVWTVTPSTVTITNGKLSIPADFDTATEITLTATWKPAVQKRYIEIAEDITNGTVTTNPPAGVVAVGTEVTVIATPADGYKLGAITVVDYQKNPVAVTGDKFTMPNSDVTVSATFVKEISITEEGNVSTDGNVTADINPNEADLNDKIAEAKKDDNKAVTFEVTVPEADEAKAETANVTLSKAAVKSVSDENLAVIVKTPVATVNVPAATMKKIVAGTSTTNVKLVVDKPSASDVAATVASVGSFDVKFKDANNKEVKVDSELTLTMKVKGTMKKVWVYLYKGGKASVLGDTDKAYDVVNGEVTFTAPHLTAFVAQEAQDTTAKPETKVELSFETAKNVTGGIVTVTGVEANKLHVIQITKKLSAKEQASVISFAESDQNGVLKFQAQGNSYISVFAPKTTITDPLIVKIDDLTSLKYEWLATATEAK